jgi:hypothetical protein
MPEGIIDEFQKQREELNQLVIDMKSFLRYFNIPIQRNRAHINKVIGKDKYYESSDRL